MKKMVSKYIELHTTNETGLQTYDIKDGYIKEIIPRLQSLLELYGDSAYLNTNVGRYDSIEIELTYQREETDEEYSNRTQREKLKQEELTRKVKLKEDSEYQTYLELKSKFGGI